MFQEADEVAEDSQGILKLLPLLASDRAGNVTGAHFVIDVVISPRYDEYVRHGCEG